MANKTWDFHVTYRGEIVASTLENAELIIDNMFTIKNTKIVAVDGMSMDLNLKSKNDPTLLNG